MPKSTVHVVNAALLLLLFAGSVLALGDLPGTIPHYFSLTGEPDGHSGRLTWFMLPGIGLTAVALVYGCAWIVRTRPGSLNMPNQAQFDALPAAAKRCLALFWTHILYWIATSVIVLLAALQLGIYEVTTGRVEALPPYVMAVLVLTLVAPPLFTPLLIWITQRRVDRLSEQENR